jgi:hypothetical protein
VLGGVRQQRDAEAHESESSEFETGQHHRHADGPFEQGVGQPGVERKHRRFEGEAQEHQPKNQKLLVQRNGNREQFQQIERVQLVHVMQGGVVVIIDIQERDAHQHEHAAKQRVEHIFQCRVMPFCAAPPELDQEVARDQHEFPEHEEKN